MHKAEAVQRPLDCLVRKKLLQPIQLLPDCISCSIPRLSGSHLSWVLSRDCVNLDSIHTPQACNQLYRYEQQYHIHNVVERQPLKNSSASLYGRSGAS